jgi:hypothetical protein
MIIFKESNYDRESRFSKSSVEPKGNLCKSRYSNLWYELDTTTTPKKGGETFNLEQEVTKIYILSC